MTSAAPLQKNRGIKLRFVSSREFREREKELNERPNRILEAGKKTIADFLERPEGTLWKEAVLTTTGKWQSSSSR
jgi:hypothetical protein